jgi:glucose dehydrogenase
LIPTYVCCSFIGHLNAYNVNTGELLWSKDMLPRGQNYSGAAIWGGAPAIDPFMNQVIIATGNNYANPNDVTACRELVQNLTGSITFFRDPCIAPNVYQESVIALDLETGNVNWVNQLSPLDSWTAACGLSAYGLPFQPGRCPPSPGPDADFGQAPVFIAGNANTYRNRYGNS